MPYYSCYAITPILPIHILLNSVRVFKDRGTTLIYDFRSTIYAIGNLDIVLLNIRKVV